MKKIYLILLILSILILSCKSNNSGKAVEIDPENNIQNDELTKKFEQVVEGKEMPPEPVPEETPEENITEEIPEPVPEETPETTTVIEINETTEPIPEEGNIITAKVISIQDVTFSEENVMILKGTTVEFQNNEQTKPHLIQCYERTTYEKIRSPKLLAGENFLYKFDSLGDYRCRCIFAPDQLDMDIYVVDVISEESA